MSLKQLFTLLISTGCLHACGQNFRGNTDTVSFTVYDKEIKIRTHKYGDPQLSFLSLHDNEDTGVKAAFEFMRIYGASVTEVNYGSVRNIAFRIDTNYYEIDPNRIFSPHGINAFYQDAEPALRISSFADTLLKVYDYKKHGYIITLHNNTDSAFNIHSYLEGEYLEGTAAEVFINPQMDTDDFILVTEPFFYNYLKEEDVNVVLQSSTAPDDGSLSVYAAAHKIPYINIEVEHRHVDENYRLIKVVNAMMQDYRKQRLIADHPTFIN